MERNNLYPIFLKTSQLKILIVGGGFVAEEKLHFLTKSSPDAQVSMVAPMFRPDTLALAQKYKVKLEHDLYKCKYLVGQHMVIAATDKPCVNEKVYTDCRRRNILVNVADNPPLCDFYMGGIVTKGHVKVAISTNGKSPTTAKRLRQFFEEVLPNDISKMVENLNLFRKTIKGDFEEKVEQMNAITQPLAPESMQQKEDFNRTRSITS